MAFTKDQNAAATAIVGKYAQVAFDAFRWEALAHDVALALGAKSPRDVMSPAGKMLRVLIGKQCKPENPKKDPAKGLVKQSARILDVVGHEIGHQIDNPIVATTFID